jgi:hypothetical protein
MPEPVQSKDAMPQTSSAATLATLRVVLRGVLLVGVFGTAADLLLIGHDEDVLQLIPLAALAASAVTTLWMIATRPAGVTAAARIFQAAMALQIAAGAAGSVLHYRANMEFKLEMDPSMRGFALFSSVMQAKSPPALAPGTMVLLGFVGLASTFRLDSGNTTP